MSKCLIAYFSRAGENYVDGEIKNLKVGNTEIVANLIKEILNVKNDMFKIEPVKKYSDNYSECIEMAKEDLKKNVRPELDGCIESIDDYDVIYLGYPNYWGTMPMAVFAFLEKFDFTGKIIKPFCTHEGSGMGNSKKDIEKICPTANVLEGLAIKGTDAMKSKEYLKNWIYKNME